MSNYPPPNSNYSLYNEANFSYANNALTLGEADARYLKLTGGIELGLVSFSAGLSTANIYNGGFTFTVPSSSGQLALVSQIPSLASYVDLTSPQTISGVKTFSANPIISAISNTGTLTLPTSTDTLVGRATTDILTNKSLVDASCFWVNSVDNTKKLAWSLGTQTASTTLTLISNQTTSQSLNIPNITATDTILTLGLTQTITATKNFTGGSGIVTSGVYPRTSASNQQSSTFTTPAIQIGGNTNDGIYSSTTDVIDIGTQGTNYISLQPQGIYRFVGGTNDPAIVFNQRIQAYNGANGATSPGIQIDNQNSGFYRVNQGTIGIGISGVATARWSSAGLNIFGVAGTAGAPALVLANDTTSGIYRPAANQIGISCSGSQVSNWSSTGLAITGGLSTTTTINSAAGTVGNPAIYFSTDTTSGLYRPAANQIGISISGSQVGNWTSTGLSITGTLNTTSLITSNAQNAGIIYGGTQSIPNGGAALNCSSQVSSAYFTCTPASGTISFTVSTAGFFLISISVEFATNSTGIREIYVEDNNSLRPIDIVQNPVSAVSSRLAASQIWYYTAGTYTLTGRAYQDTGGSITIGSSVNPTKMAVYKLT